MWPCHVAQVLQTKPMPCSMSWSPPTRGGFLLALADTSGRVPLGTQRLPMENEAIRRFYEMQERMKMDESKVFG